MRLRDKRAIITGGASGIGKAIGQRFLAEGASVALFDLNAEQLKKTVTVLEEEYPGRIYGIRCDVGDAADVQLAFSQAVDALKGLDILVNNAGVIRFSPIVDMLEEDWDHILRTNLKSVFLCSKAAARELIRQNTGGRIISISSIHAVLSLPNSGHYSASKGGVESFSHTLATELAPYGINVNYIRPGATYTELTTPMYTESVKRALYNRVPQKRIADAAWIANGAIFLASDDSQYMTGQNLTIDGGYLMDGRLPDATYCND